MPRPCASSWSIQDALGGETAWLDLLRPPRSLHYSASAAAGDAGSGEATIAGILDEEDVGFGYGALAAGAEIAVAEALLARGAELHVILPSDAASFAARFVDPFGPTGAAGSTPRSRRPRRSSMVRPLQVPPDGRMAALAHEVALGAAMLNAERLMGEAVAADRLAEATSPVRMHVIEAPAGPDADASARSRGRSCWRCSRSASAAAARRGSRTGSRTCRRCWRWPARPGSRPISAAIRS